MWAKTDPFKTPKSALLTLQTLSGNTWAANSFCLPVRSRLQFFLAVPDLLTSRHILFLTKANFSSISCLLTSWKAD